MGSGQLHQVMSQVSKCVRLPFTAPSLPCDILPADRDPSQHASLAAQIDEQAMAHYASARLWDDGILRPQDTRDALGLGLALSKRKKGGAGGAAAGGTTWDGEGKGWGVFRM